MPSAMYSLDTDGNTSSHGSLSNSSGYSSQSTTGTTGSDDMLPSQGIKGVSLKRGFNARISFVRLLFFNRRSLHEFCEKSPPYVSTFGWNWMTFHFILYSEFWCHRTSTTNGFVQQYRMKKLNPMLFCGVPPTSKTEHFSLLPYPVICTTCHCAVIGCKVIWKRKKKVIGIHITIKTG